MRMLIVAIVGVLLVTSLACAQDDIRVTMPAEGAVLGPNYDILGSAGHRAFLVVMTDCIRTDTGEIIRSVPGIRHWTNPDGSFHFRVASPRVYIGERDTFLVYKMRVFEVTKDGPGPETVLNGTMPE